jgi:anthranilate synthase/aminodeoxychorismate synthase-like glutamine amidotransferase
VHGKISRIYHDGSGIFTKMPQGFPAARYHSLVVDRAGLPSALKISARSDEGEIMGLRHRRFPIEGVQFHPESVLTPDGKQLLRNFLSLPSALAQEVYIR